jgi:hypothetical protein
VIKFSPISSDRLAISTSEGIQYVAFRIMEVISQKKKSRFDFADDRNIRYNYFIEKDPSFLIIHSKFKEALNSDKLSPFKSNRILDYFVEPKVYKKMNNISSFKRHPDLKRNIILLGDRGVGKTTSFKA